jgi:sialidase-1
MRNMSFDPVRFFECYATPLLGTAAPVPISRFPTSGGLLTIWNRNPRATKRNPLVTGISKDEGKTWLHIRVVEDAEDDIWTYPAVTWIGSDAYLLYFNYKWELSLQLKILPANWFYE